MKLKLACLVFGLLAVEMSRAAMPTNAARFPAISLSGSGHVIWSTGTNIAWEGGVIDTNTAFAAGLLKSTNAVAALGTLGGSNMASVIQWETGSWLYRFAENLMSSNILKVSMLGDSIIAGSYNLPISSGVWTPEYANNLCAFNPKFTQWTGTNHFIATNAIKSTGCTLSGAEFTMVGSTNETNPRFGDFNDKVTLQSGKLFFFYGELNNSQCVGTNLALRLSAVADINVGGDAENMGGYIRFNQVLSSDYLMNTTPPSTQIFMGGELVGPSTSGTGIIRNCAFYECSSGIAIHNQGISGNYSTNGLARMNTVTNWGPTIVVIAFGTNDIRAGGADVDGFINTISNICVVAESGGAYPVVANMPPLGYDQTNFESVPLWNARLKSLALSNRWGFWDRWGALKGDLQYIEDGRHPNKLGYKKLGEDFASLLTGTR